MSQSEAAWRHDMRELEDAYESRIFRLEARLRDIEAERNACIEKLGKEREESSAFLGELIALLGIELDGLEGAGKDEVLRRVGGLMARAGGGE